MTSVVIPAHNEETVIARCLRRLCDRCDADQLDVIVVANGCSDRTADVAREFEGVNVVELGTASKAAALNAGDSLAVGFPRFYLDADVELDYKSLLVTVNAMEESGAEVAAPKLEWADAGRSFAVKSYYRVWEKMPYGQDNLVGVGVYALSRAGRGRFEDFPAIIADDLFIRNIFPPELRLTVECASFLIHPPYNLRNLLRMLTRQWVGNDQLASQREVLTEEDRWSRRIGWLKARWSVLAEDRSLWMAVPVHALIYGSARVAARYKRVRGDYSWGRDLSSRRLN
ncbi:glycosyltransferase [Actinomycetospora flava]|uniref:4,4'-diaponeurosporenoate glycosyltransferase n=1 Tax=Actinomycetospora flava TaxID=3129232 RepID=A0ABU8M6P1_9PSEU